MFTIAVCDDDMQERMQEVQIVKNIFSQKELEAGIEEFQTGQHFLDVLHRVPYDIVLLDIQMGEVSGFTLAEELYKITGGGKYYCQQYGKIWCLNPFISDRFVLSENHIWRKNLQRR